MISPARCPGRAAGWACNNGGLTSRLESPDVLVIEQRGQAVTISPWNAPGISFAADGRERSVRVANGRTVSARAMLSGKKVVANATARLEKVTGPFRGAYSLTADGESHALAGINMHGTSQAVIVNDGGSMKVVTP
jgi:hypothetical protein